MVSLPSLFQEIDLMGIGYRQPPFRQIDIYWSENNGC